MDLEIWVFNDDRCEDVEMSDGWGAEHNEGVLSDLEEIALHQQAVWTCWVWTEWDELKWNQWICTDDILIHRNLHGHIGYQSLEAIFNVLPVAACLIALALPCLPNISAKNARKLKRLKVWKPAVDISSHLASHIKTIDRRSSFTIITVHTNHPLSPLSLSIYLPLSPISQGFCCFRTISFQRWKVSGCRQWELKIVEVVGKLSQVKDWVLSLKQLYSGVDPIWPSNLSLQVELVHALRFEQAEGAGVLEPGVTPRTQDLLGISVNLLHWMQLWIQH